MNEYFVTRIGVSIQLNEFIIQPEISKIIRISTELKKVKYWESILKRGKTCCGRWL